MTYVLLSAVFVGIAVVAAVLARIASKQRPSLPAIVATVAALFVLTAVFDTVMIAVGLFSYDETQLAGLFIGLAPVEDFAYPLAGAVLLPALWVALRARRSRRGGSRD